MVTQKKKNILRQNRWAWLDDAIIHEKQGFTFPQVKSSLVFYETPASLSRKVPVVPGPTDVIKLCTTKLGTKRFQVPPDAEFDLNDPYMPPTGYNFLHDPHLQEYLNNPLVKTRLYEKGLITKDGYVKCTIKEFNDYRQWIRKLKLDAIDQDWHLKKSVQPNRQKTVGNSTNNEALQLTKQRQERARTLYKQKQEKKEKGRKRYLREMEQKDRNIEGMKRERNRKLEQQRKQRDQAFRKKVQAQQEKELSGKKIRLKILLKSKKSLQQREDRINEMHEERLHQKEIKAMELWNRRQSYCREKMEQEKHDKEMEESQRRSSITRRESIYQKERRKSDVYMMQHHRENRDNALKHLMEAEEFFNRIEAKKECEIKRWRTKLKTIEEREKLFDYYREKESYNEKSGKYRKRHDKDRKSIWDVDNVLLKHIFNDLTESERRELEGITDSHDFVHMLEKVANKEEDKAEGMKESNSIVQSDVTIGVENELDPNSSATVEKTDIGLTSHRRSFVTFGNIRADDTVDVYYQKERNSACKVGESFKMLDIPGLVIHHTKSVNEHLPVVDSDHDKFEPVESSHERFVEMLSSDPFPNEDNSEQAVTCSKESSYEILVIPSRPSSLDVQIDSSTASKITLIHLIDQEPVLVSSTYPRTPPVENELIKEKAQQIVQESLKNAARQLGYSEEMIAKQIGLKPSCSPLESVTSESIIQHSKEITEISLVAAAVSLGYELKEISEVLGVDMEALYNSEGLDTEKEERAESVYTELGEMYDETIADIVLTAMKHAALNLGYTEKDAENAIKKSTIKTLQYHSSRSSLSSLASEIAKTAILNASFKLSLQNTPSVGSLIDDVDNRLSATNTVRSSYSIKSNDTNKHEEPVIIVTHNALRNAALSLGYKEGEVNTIIGEEKCYKKDAIESEYIMQRYSSRNLQRQSTHPSQYYGNLHEAAEDIVDNVIKYAIDKISSEGSVRDIERYFDATDQNDWKFEVVAKNLIKNVVENAVRIFKEEIEEKENIKMNKELKEFALTFSMVIIGSAGKRLGYSDASILKALTKDLNKTGKHFEKHPNALVRFNEDSITKAMQENIEIHKAFRIQGRRASVKDRILTPKPSQTNSINEEGAEGQTDIPDTISCEKNEDVKESTAKDQEIREYFSENLGKQRRLTPFFPETVQKRLCEQFNERHQHVHVFSALQEDDEEEGEEYKDEHSPSDQVNWSLDFLKKIESITEVPTLETLAEVESSFILSQSQHGQEDSSTQVHHTQGPTVRQLSEYPTETEFLTQQCQQKNLMSILGHSELAPGILELYNNIHMDVIGLLSRTNLQLLASQSPSPSQSCNNQNIACQSPQSTTPTQPDNKDENSREKAINSVSAKRSSSIYCQYHKKKATEAGQYNQKLNKRSSKQMQNLKKGSVKKEKNQQEFASKLDMFPKLTKTSQVCLTGDTSSIKTNTKTSLKVSNTTVELPSLPKQSQSSRISLQKTPTTSTTQTLSLPELSKERSGSVIVGQNETEKPLQIGMSKSSKDSLQSEELEIVLRSPKDFETSNFTLNDEIDDSVEKKAIYQSSKPSIDRKKATDMSVSSIHSIQSSDSKTKGLNNNKPQPRSPSKQQSLHKSSSTSSSKSELKKVGSKVNSSNKTNEYVRPVTPNYAKPLKRSVEAVCEPQKQRSVTEKEHKLTSDGPSVFERLSAIRRPSVDDSTKDFHNVDQNSINKVQSNSIPHSRNKSSIKKTDHHIMKTSDSPITEILPESTTKIQTKRPNSSKLANKFEGTTASKKIEMNQLEMKTKQSVKSAVEVPVKSSTYFVSDKAKNKHIADINLKQQTKIDVLEREENTKELQNLLKKFSNELKNKSDAKTHSKTAANKKSMPEVTALKSQSSKHVSEIPLNRYSTKEALESSAIKSTTTSKTEQQQQVQKVKSKSLKSNSSLTRKSLVEASTGKSKSEVCPTPDLSKSPTPLTTIKAKRKKSSLGRIDSSLESSGTVLKSRKNSTHSFADKKNSKYSSVGEENNTIVGQKSLSKVAQENMEGDNILSGKSFEKGRNNTIDSIAEIPSTSSTKLKSLKSELSGVGQKKSSASIKKIQSSPKNHSPLSPTSVKSSNTVTISSSGKKKKKSKLVLTKSTNDKTAMKSTTSISQPKLSTNEEKDKSSKNEIKSDVYNKSNIGTLRNEGSEDGNIEDLVISEVNDVDSAKVHKEPALNKEEQKKSTVSKPDSENSEAENKKSLVKVTLSKKELDDIHENEPVSCEAQNLDGKSKKDNQKIQAKISNAISTVSLTFNKGYSSETCVNDVSKSDNKVSPSRSKNSNASIIYEYDNSIGNTYGQSISSMQPTASSVKFVSSPPSSHSKTSQMVLSQSARSIYNNRNMRAISKSKSSGSPHRINSTDARTKNYSQSTFRETIPSVFDMDYGDSLVKAPSINDVISRRSSSKTTSAVWMPSDSIVKNTSATGENLHSPSAVLLKSTNSSFKSGQILVTPAASISFNVAASVAANNIDRQVPSLNTIDVPKNEPVSAEQTSNL